MLLGTLALSFACSSLVGGMLFGVSGVFFFFFLLLLLYCCVVLSFGTVLLLFMLHQEGVRTVKYDKRGWAGLPGLLECAHGPLRCMHACGHLHPPNRFS